jgi:hypothetical protein
MNTSESACTVRPGGRCALLERVLRIDALHRQLDQIVGLGADSLQRHLGVEAKSQAVFLAHERLAVPVGAALADHAIEQRPRGAAPGIEAQVQSRHGSIGDAFFLGARLLYQGSNT